MLLKNLHFKRILSCILRKTEACLLNGISNSEIIHFVNLEFGSQLSENNL